MANRYAVAAGGNWTADATWSTTDGGAPDTVAPTASDDVFLTVNSGNVTISATSVGKSLTCTGYTGTLTHNNFSLTISGSITFVSGMNYVANAGSSCNIWMNASGTFTSAGKLIRGFVPNGTITATLGDNLNFMDSKLCLLQITLSTTTLNLNGKTVSGFSSTSRVLIRSGTLGTSATITNTTGTFANADFRDITFSTNADYSAITGLSGDCGGNSGITFTTAATQTYTGGTGSWSDVTKWTSRVPLPQDDVSMSGVTGGTITADMPRLGKSIDWTGASGSPTWAINSIANTNYGSLTLISGMSLSVSNYFYFEGRGNFNLTSAGKSMMPTWIQMVGGKLTLQDAYTSTGQLVVNYGTLEALTSNVSVPSFYSIYSVTRGITMGSGVWSITSTGAATNWGISATAMTFNAGTSTIFLTSTSANTNTFAGGINTYNDLKIAGGGSGSVVITSANTFNRIYTDGGGTKSITLPGSTTTTILSGQGLGNGTNVITFTSSAGTATLSKTTAGPLQWPYVNLTAIAATQTSKFYAPLSTDGGGNTNWIFGYAPVVGGVGTGRANRIAIGLMI